MTLYSVKQQQRISSAHDPSKRENGTVNRMINESDVVAQHENRLKLEVEEHISPESILHREPVKTKQTKIRASTPPPLVSQKSNFEAPVAKKSYQRPSVTISIRLGDHRLHQIR